MFNFCVIRPRLYSELIMGGIKCLAVQADVTKEEDVVRAIEEAVKAFGRIDYAA